MRPRDLVIDDQQPAFEFAWSRVEACLAVDYVWNTTVRVVFSSKEVNAAVLRAVARRLDAEGWTVVVQRQAADDCWVVTITHKPLSFS